MEKILQSARKSLIAAWIEVEENNNKRKNYLKDPLKRILVRTNVSFPLYEGSE